MGGLREKKKKKSEDKIVKISEELFMSKGYSGTTMEEIAQKAEIGVGTLYNYFPSKAEIFISMMANILELNAKDTVQLEIDIENDVVKIVTDFLFLFLKRMKIFSKKMFKELMAVVFGNIKSNNLLFNGMMKLDFRYIEKLKCLLENIKERGLLSESFNVNEAAYAIYGILMTQLLMYCYIDSMTFDELSLNIENQMKFIFEGKASIHKIDGDLNKIKK